MDVVVGRWGGLSARHPELELLLLVGSRAVERQHAGSDWDFGALGGDGMDLMSLRADVSAVVGSDDVDVVDLRTASAVLRRDAALTGRALIERTDTVLAAFQLEAITFWCDVAPVVREAHADVLRSVTG